MEDNYDNLDIGILIQKMEEKRSNGELTLAEYIKDLIQKRLNKMSDTNRSKWEGRIPSLRTLFILHHERTQLTNRQTL